MTTLSYDKQREFDTQRGLELVERAYPVVASDIIYEGAAVSIDASGNALPNTGATGGNYFVGFAYRRADNSTGAAGAIRVDVTKEGYVKLNVTNVNGAEDVGMHVWATDDDTFVGTTSGTASGTAGQPLIGKVTQYIGADGFKNHAASTCIVHFVSHDLTDSGDVLLSTA